MLICPRCHRQTVRPHCPKHVPDCTWRVCTACKITTNGTVEIPFPVTEQRL